MSKKDHWEQVYASKDITKVSWFQEHANISLKLINAYSPTKDTAIIDIGSGASCLPNDLLQSGFTNITVLDISSTALLQAQKRLANRASAIHWLEADITTRDLPPNNYHIWHDRAVFHFLITKQERAAYKTNLIQALTPDGLAIIATFAANGPEQCSNLPVCRYSIIALQEEFASHFDLIHSEQENHITPAGNKQAFIYGVFRRR